MNTTTGPGPAPGPTTAPAPGNVVPGPGTAAAPAPAADAKESKPKRKAVRHPKFPDDYKITVFIPNSKSRGAQTRFNEYKTGQTVKEYVELVHGKYNRSVAMVHADLRWDSREDHRFIHVGPEVVPVPPAPPPPPAAKPAAPAQPTA